MKCPKCGYLGFEQSERCRNCGYTFSLAEQPSKADADLPLREGETAGPLADFDLGEASRPPAAARRRRTDPDLAPRITPAPPAADDLPLFVREPGAEDQPLVIPSAPSAPLAVRRGSPPVARPRQRVTPREVEAPSLASLPLPDPTPDAQPALGASVGPDEASASGAAGTGARLLAGIVDWLILLGVDAVVVYFTLRVCRLSFADVGALPMLPLAAFLLLFDGGYLALLTAAGGQTIGKMALGLKVVDESGDRPTLPCALLRTTAFLACAAPAGVGLVPTLLGSRRGLHDLVARTRVVRSATA